MTRGSNRKTSSDMHETVLILDFGSQFTQLIARRVRENRVYCEVHPFNLPLDEIRRRKPVGLILSGGPQSVYEAEAPSADPPSSTWDPVLGICYGMQVMAHAWAARWRIDHREYGRAEIASSSRAGCSRALRLRDGVE